MYNFRSIYSENTDFTTNHMQSPVFQERKKVSKASQLANKTQNGNNQKTRESDQSNEPINNETIEPFSSTASGHNGNGNDLNKLQTESSGNSLNKMLPDVLISEEINNGRIRTLTLAKPEIEDINIGFNLTRSQWDPYPWVKCVDKGSCADRAGLREGDCLIKVGDEDLLGLKINDIATLVRSQQKEVPLLVWSTGLTKEGDSDSLLLGPLPLALTRLSSCLASILRAAECPVCARTIPAPAHQCPSGHLLCSTCRSRMEFCPLCRSALGRCRNLLADEVYNCVLENFDLRPDKRERLTKTLFGEDAKFIETHGTTRSLGNLQETSRQAKWGTQKLLDRLLPGRARSTGNIARVGVRNSRMLIEDDRDVSKSLSTLDVARCSTEVSPCHSLPSMTGGSCDSIHQNVRYAVDQSEISNRAARQEPVIRYNCPVDSSCKGTIAGDIQPHIVLSHDVEVLLKQCDGRIKLGNTSGVLVSLIHKSGLWFYPKYHRDERNKGIKIWCWVLATSVVSSKYTMNIELHKRTMNDRRRKESRESIMNGNKFERNENKNTKMIVSAMVHNGKESSQNTIRESQEEIIIAGKVEIERNSNEIDDGICVLVENSIKDDAQSITKCYIDAINVEEVEKESILKFNAPVISLVEFGWNDVLSNANRSVFLSDCILNDNVEVTATIIEMN